MDLVAGREHLFPDLQARVYWAFAAIAPLAKPVRAAVDAWYDQLAREGMPAFMTGLAAREQLRTDCLLYTSDAADE